MKKIAISTAVFLFALVLTKIANQMPPEAPPGIVFSLKAQLVVECTPDEIALVDIHWKPTHLEKDSTWPDCSMFQRQHDQFLDFFLLRGEKTRFQSYEKTAWWRKLILGRNRDPIDESISMVR
jgi:hypothetical protein